MTTSAKSHFDREALAQNYANLHFDVDEGVREIHFLPQGAPPREIRLLEVNSLVAEIQNPEPIDFGVDMGPDRHVLVVLDITPHQWDLLQKGLQPMPAGWSLKGKKLLKRRSP